MLRGAEALVEGGSLGALGSADQPDEAAGSDGRLAQVSGSSE
jgi:hypothetical protein